MRTVLGLCFRGAKTNTVLHSQAPALHTFARVQTPWTNRGQRGVARGRSWALNSQVMNTLTKVLVLFCLLLSAVVFAKWSAIEAMSSHPADRAEIMGIATSADGKIVYLAKFNVLFKSTDGGETWTVLRY